MNQTERKAFNWLVKQGILESEISFRARKTPDFLIADGRGYEVKLLGDYGIYTTPKQLEKLRKKNSTLLVFRPSDEEPMLVAPFNDVEKLINVYVQPKGEEVVRIDADLTEEDVKRVRDYAKEHGLRMRKAYSELLSGGLEAYEIVKIQTASDGERDELVKKIKKLRSVVMKRMEAHAKGPKKSG